MTTINPPQDHMRSEKGSKSHHFSHFFVLLPLALTHLIQRLEHIVDNQFSGILGGPILEIHSIQGIFFLLGQALGAGSATSLFIFWKREDSKDSQLSILHLHLLLTLVLSIITVLGILPFVPTLTTYFSIPPDYYFLANRYLTLGLITTIVQALYFVINAALIASDMRKTSILLTAGILSLKIITLSIARAALWNGNPDPISTSMPFLTLIGSTFLAVALASTWGYKLLSRKITKTQTVSAPSVFKTGLPELGTSLIRGSAPFIFALLLGKVSTSNPGFFVSYQLALQAAYLLTLPILAGTQLAIRDASAEESATNSSVPLKNAWLKVFVLYALTPSVLLLLIGSWLPAAMLHLFFGYSVPEPHIGFLRLYFLAVIIGQAGNLFVIRLRARKENTTVLFMLLKAEFGVQIGLTALLISKNRATPLALGGVILAYCSSYLALGIWRNWDWIKTSSKKSPWLKTFFQGTHTIPRKTL